MVTRKKNRQCIIIGAGINGLISALHLKKHHHDILIIDNNKPTATQAGAGILAPLPHWSYTPAMQGLIQQGAAAYPDILAQINDNCGYQPCGIALIPAPTTSTTPATVANKRQRWLSKNAVPISDSKAVSTALCPPANPLYLYPDAATLTPQLLLNALKRHLKAHIINDEATHYQQHNNTVTQVQLKHHPNITCQSLIITAGVWSNRFIANNVIPSITPIRGQLIGFSNTRIRLHHVLFDETDGLYCVQRQSGQIVVGATQEQVGYQAVNSLGGIRLLWKKARALFPCLQNARPDATWVGLRPYYKKNSLFIHRHPTLSNLYFNAGHHRYGVTLAPVSAQQLLQMMADS